MRGYATEALRAMVEFGFDALDLHRIHSGGVVSHAVSIRVPEKAGFTQEGKTPMSFPIGDVREDYLLFGLLRSSL